MYYFPPPWQDLCSCAWRRCDPSGPDYNLSFIQCSFNFRTDIDNSYLATWENLRKLPDPPEFSRNLPSPSVRATHFTRDDRIIVCYLDHGIVWVPSALSSSPLTTFTVAGTWLRWESYGESGRGRVICTCSYTPCLSSLTSSSGYSAISPDEKHLAISNLFDGLDWYSITEHKLSHSVPCPINLQNNIPIPVRFGDDGGIIIVGGSSGNARILDSMTAETIQSLSHDGTYARCLS